MHIRHARYRFVSVYDYFMHLQKRTQKSLFHSLEPWRRTFDFSPVPVAMATRREARNDTRIVVLGGRGCAVNNDYLFSPVLEIDPQSPI